LGANEKSNKRQTKQKQVSKKQMKDSSPQLLFLLLPVVLVHHSLHLLLFLHVALVLLKECFLLTLFSFALDRFTVLCSGKDNNNDDTMTARANLAWARARVVALAKVTMMRADKDDSKIRVLALARVTSDDGDNNDDDKGKVGSG
jgi:hypothetical protein